MHNFIKLLEGGPSEHDAAFDNDAIPLLLDEDPDAEDALGMKMYKNHDPLSPDHFALHLPKCTECPGCDWRKTS